MSGSLHSIKKKHEILITSGFEDDYTVKIILFQDILMILFLQKVVGVKVKQCGPIKSTNTLTT